MYRIILKLNIIIKYRINSVGSSGDRVCLSYRSFCFLRLQFSIESYLVLFLDRAGFMSVFGVFRVNYVFFLSFFFIREVIFFFFIRQYRFRDDSLQQRGFIFNYFYNVIVVLCFLVLGYIGGVISVTWFLRFGFDFLFLFQSVVFFRL